MIDLKRLGKKLLFLPIWLTVLLTVVSAVGLAYVFLNGIDTASPISIIVYVVSFYTLCVLTVFCVKTLPRYYKAAKTGVYNNKYGNRYMTDAEFRTRVSLTLSLGINMLYVAINLVSGAIYHTAWFYVLAVYYTILSVMRFLLVRYVHKVGVGNKRSSELNRARLCSTIMLTLNLALSGAVLMILYQDKGYEYHGILIYVMAAYTFYITVHAIINLFKYKKFNSPVMSTAKMISLASALVSMLSLETAMLTEFSDGSMTLAEQRIMIAATGGGISIVIVGMSILMIVLTSRELRGIKEKNKDDGK